MSASMNPYPANAIDRTCQTIDRTCQTIERRWKSTIHVPPVGIQTTMNLLGAFMNGLIFTGQTRPQAPGNYDKKR